MMPHSMFHDRPPRRHQEKPALFHGLDGRDVLICVDDLDEGGKTDLRCPYCKGLLTAKKGDVVTHHFAHTIGKRECAAFISRAPRIALPLYDSFDWGISPTAIRYLFWRSQGDAMFPETKAMRSMLGAGLVQINDHTGNIELTKTGKMVTGKLSLGLFCEMQEKQLLKRLDELEHDARRGGELEKTDLALYRARLVRAFSEPLVLSQAIDSAGQVVLQFYRIGTDDTVAAPVKVLPHRAHLLTYFQHRFADDLKLLPGEDGKRPATTFQFEFDDEEKPGAYLRSVKTEMARVPKIDDMSFQQFSQPKIA